MSEKEITASRTIDAPADTLFSVLSNPERHAELDGSGLVQSDDKSDRITAVGQMFTMNMHWEKMGGDYKTDNHVVGFDENKLLAWETAPQGQQPPGWQWVWELEPQGPDSTKVSVTYDWSSVTDKDVLKQISFPAIPQEDLESSLGNLASAVSQVQRVSTVNRTGFWASRSNPVRFTTDPASRALPGKQVRHLPLSQQLIRVHERTNLLMDTWRSPKSRGSCPQGRGPLLVRRGVACEK